MKIEYSEQSLAALMSSIVFDDAEGFVQRVFAIQKAHASSTIEEVSELPILALFNDAESKTHSNEAADSQLSRFSIASMLKVYDASHCEAALVEAMESQLKNDSANATQKASKNRHTRSG